ncbi:hypothetical protein [Campylobacter curvus]|uniref:hypothetical protein n=1 Tax=Campylobacter curvus TaxID=200 RepID=UPI0014706928|nr:hypothetical protein [Campylobacter curvus]
MNEIDKYMNEAFRSMNNINKITEKEIEQMYNASIIADLISLIIFIAIIFFIYRNYENTKRLERENEIIKRKLQNIEEHLEEKSGYKIKNIDPFFDF